MDTLHGVDGSLRSAILGALDSLLSALELEPVKPEPVGTHTFRARNESERFTRIFGGQSIAQAVIAASATVPEGGLHSLHAYFVHPGDNHQTLDLTVDAVRDGRSMATRQVSVSQSGRPLLVAMTSFGTMSTTPASPAPAPTVLAPEELPLLQDWARDAPPEAAPNALGWVHTPPPLEIRIGEAPYFLGGARAHGPRSHWMRLPRSVGEDPVLHTALLAYATDYFLLDMALRSYPLPVPLTSLVAVSLDHAVWLHRPVRFDRWHVHTQDLVTISGERALIRGTIHDEDGHHVASTTQEALIRVPGQESRR
ncbi:acyl-CoA thioesterase [Nocardia aurea]|uniref:Acyl-CoA thioesterase domain-containing protein n=1 Tax=Nocardia aurea TaxID=2144174 RepID=A0ABV3FSK3_9NOCA